jgi:hypothetical protein
MNAIEHTISHQSGENCFWAICLFSASASITRVADINNGFEASSLANFQVLHSLADLDNHASSFVACTTSSKLGHWWECPVVHHEVDIAHAKTGCIELDENIFRSWSWNIHILDFLEESQPLYNTGSAEGLGGFEAYNTEIRTFVHDNPCLALLWDLEGFKHVSSCFGCCLRHDELCILNLRLVDTLMGGSTAVLYPEHYAVETVERNPAFWGAFRVSSTTLTSDS